MSDPTHDIPAWLCEPEDYQPQADRDGFVTKNALALSSALRLLRLDDGAEGPLSPSTPAKLVGGLVCILLTSLARNYLFVLIVLAALLVRVCLLPARSLARVAAVAGGAAALTFVVMLPAALLGQPQSAALMATKSLTCTGITMTVALTTPLGKLTSTLRSLGVPALVIMTLDIALRSIVRLGETALEVLSALTLRSVGTNHHKTASMGGVGGVVLIKAGVAAQDTLGAMRCRGFDGTYHTGAGPRLKRIDLLWGLALVALVALFVHLQGAMLP